MEAGAAVHTPGISLPDDSDCLCTQTAAPSVVCGLGADSAQPLIEASALCFGLVIDGSQPSIEAPALCGGLVIDGRSRSQKQLLCVAW